MRRKPIYSHNGQLKQSESVPRTWVDREGYEGEVSTGTPIPFEPFEADLNCLQRYYKGNIRCSILNPPWHPNEEVRSTMEISPSDLFDALLKYGSVPVPEDDYFMIHGWWQFEYKGGTIFIVPAERPD